jgi:hypothetical protein
MDALALFGVFAASCAFGSASIFSSAPDRSVCSKRSGPLRRALLDTTDLWR